MDGWIVTKKYYSTIKKHELLTYTTTGANPTNITMSKRSQMQKSTYGMYSSSHHNKFKNMQTNLQLPLGKGMMSSKVQSKN